MQQRYQLREAVEYTGMPRGTLKSRRDALRDDPKSPDRKFLHPSDKKYRELTSANKDIQWELDAEILDRWMTEWRKKKSKKQTKRNPQPQQIEESPTRNSESGGLVELLREELQTRKKELDDEREHSRASLEKEREFSRSLEREHRQELQSLNQHVTQLSIENRELQMLTKGVVYGSRATNGGEATVEPEPTRTRTTVINVDSDRRKSVLVAVLGTLGLALGLFAAVQFVSV